MYNYVQRAGFTRENSFRQSCELFTLNGYAKMFKTISKISFTIEYNGTFIHDSTANNLIKNKRTTTIT